MRIFEACFKGVSTISTFNLLYCMTRTVTRHGEQKIAQFFVRYMEI
jgi:hypothetical protein